jgi:hypothetical protein
VVFGPGPALLGTLEVGVGVDVGADARLVVPVAVAPTTVADVAGVRVGVPAADAGDGEMVATWLGPGVGADVSTGAGSWVSVVAAAGIVVGVSVDVSVAVVAGVGVSVVGRARTWIVTVAVDVWPLASVNEYVNVSLPTKSGVGV